MFSLVENFHIAVNIVEISPDILIELAEAGIVASSNLSYFAENKSF